MENKINIAELLRNCPKGMELDCTINNNVKFIKISPSSTYPIILRTKNGYEITLTKYGQVHNMDDSKCVIFPKGKTTWEGFVPPCKFKDGDVISVIVNKNLWYGIYQKEINTVLYCYVDFSTATENIYPLDKTGMCLIDDISEIRFATEEEKQKLFDAIKANGYKWNSETKTLEKLPKFKIEKGKWYVCIKDLLDNYENKAFCKGNTYLSTQDGSLIPSNSNVPFEVVCASTYFRDWTINDIKDGDVITCNNSACTFISIFKDKPFGKSFRQHCSIILDNNKFIVGIKYADYANPRFATEEEKQKLFQAIKEHGYRWNDETKTLEKFPRFKVGDRVRSIYNNFQYDIKELTDAHYVLVEVEEKFKYTVPIIEDKNWELVPKKFDFSKLKPFDKVLVRDFDNETWEINFFSKLLDGKHFKCLDLSYVQCIPYEGNEHLYDTTNKCDEFFKVWES